MTDLTPQELASMDMETYLKYRVGLCRNPPGASMTSEEYDRAKMESIQKEVARANAGVTKQNYDVTKPYPYQVILNSRTDNKITITDNTSGYNAYESHTSAMGPMLDRIKELEKELDDMKAKVDWLMEAFEDE